MFKSLVFSCMAILIVSMAYSQNFVNSGAIINRGSGSTFTVKGSFTNNASGTFDNNNHGSLTIDSTFNQNAAAGSFVTDSGIVAYSGSNAQAVVATVRGAQYGALIAGGSSTKSLAGSVVVMDSVQLGSTLAVNGHQLSVLGVSAFTGAGTLTANGGSDTVNYAGTVNQNVRGTTYGNLIASGSATSTKTAAGAVTVNNKVTNGDTLDFAGNVFTYTGATNGITNNGTIRSGAAVSMTSQTTIGNAFVYTQASAGQTVAPANYTDLSLTGGTKSIASGDTTSVAGSYNVTGSGARNYAGSWFRYNGSTQSVLGEPYNNLTLVGADTSIAKTAVSGVTVGGTLANRAGTFDLAANTLTLTVPANGHSNTGRIRYAGTGTVVDSTAGIIEYYASSGSQTVGLGTYHNILLSNAATKTVSGGVVRALSDINVPSGAVTVASAATLQTIGNMTLLGGTTLGNAGSLFVTQTLNNAGTITNTGAVQIGQ